MECAARLLKAAGFALKFTNTLRLSASFFIGMNDSPFRSENFFKHASYFEASLLILAMILGWLADIDPFAALIFSDQAVLYGVVGTLPLFLIFLLMQRLQIDVVQEIRKLLLRTLGPSIQACNWADLFILAAIAGIAEEVLFRGVIQPWIENSWGFNAGLLLSSVLFGLVHAITPLYAVLAALVSIYLGLSLDYGGDRNLLVPVIIHSLYDFLAFMVILKAYRVQYLGEGHE